MSDNTSKNTDFSKQNGGQNLFVFLLKKTERLASAIYLMTNHFPDSEPLKRSLRDKSSSLVSFMIGYKDLNGIQLYGFGKEVESRIIEIVSLMEISQNVGLVSKMNFDIVQGEFIRLIETIKTSPIPDSMRADSHSLNQSYFNVSSYKNTPSVAQTAVSSPGYEGQVSGISGSGSRDMSSISHQKDHGLLKKNNRQGIILSIIKKKGEVSIKDISDVIKNCSEKTIQRELVSLLESGVIKRTGDRRWSKYSLI